MSMPPSLPSTETAPQHIPRQRPNSASCMSKILQMLHYHAGNLCEHVKHLYNCQSRLEDQCMAEYVPWYVTLSLLVVGVVVQKYRLGTMVVEVSQETRYLSYLRKLDTEGGGRREEGRGRREGGGREGGREEGGRREVERYLVSWDTNTKVPNRFSPATEMQSKWGFGSMLS